MKKPKNNLNPKFKDKDLVFFKKLGKKLGKTNWTKLIRIERDRDAN